MSKANHFLLALISIILLAGCAVPTPLALPTATAVPATPAAAATSTPAPVAPVTATPAAESPTAVAGDEGEPVTLTVLYTNDEHGWMAGVEEGEGAANLAGLWQERHAYTPEGNFLVLSGGDNWTGPAISTWFDGESMVTVMNAMHYAASTIGNHEFDFGLYALQARLQEADFPYLSANLRRKSDGQVPDELGIKPYAMVDVGGLQVGITGLTTTSTPGTTNPVNVADFDFIGYEAALRQVVPELRAAGADLILVPAHICLSELTELAGAVADLEIALLGGGHCNELFAGETDGAVLLIGGAHLASYAYANFTVDPDSGEVLALNYGVQANENGPADPTIATLVDQWQAAADAELNVPIGYLNAELPRRSQAMQDLITESWLAGYPADVAITNLGGMRDRLPAGEVTYGDIIGVMPFNNTLIEVRLNGRDLNQVLSGKLDEVAVGGMHREGFHWALDGTGERLDPEASYSVLVNDFMYAGGDGFEMLAYMDPDAYNTAIDWRQPVIDWIIAQESSADSPLDGPIAGLAD